MRGRRAALAALGAAALAACGGAKGMLPADRSVPLVYVALGDSTVEGIGASSPDAGYVERIHRRLREHYPNARAVNLGAAGATSADVLAHQLDRAGLLGPQLATLSVGPNDITEGGDVGVFEGNVDQILGRLASRRVIVVVNLLPDLAVTPRFRGRPEGPAVGRLTVRFNEALRRIADRHGAEVVDLYEPSRAEVPARPWLVASDGYHPSDAGYARWAELMWQGIERRLAP